ncbi:hypothetical protein QFC20_003748 [Naganishia adeliensis]|uniref:Uncharacterized protein n=1 Tax=Naganishia adeliensis TaxID=92952 RepID=A0ACC2W639_9TREE|nr:hypothetical protein QFC20_003748 [Naganishia adeliensis]
MKWLHQERAPPGVTLIQRKLSLGNRPLSSSIVERIVLSSGPLVHGEIPLSDRSKGEFTFDIHAPNITNSYLPLFPHSLLSPPTRSIFPSPPVIKQRKAYRAQAVVEMVRAIRRRHGITAGERLRNIVVINDCEDYQSDIRTASEWIEWATHVASVVVRSYASQWCRLRTLINFVKNNYTHCDIDFNGECAVLVATESYDAEYHIQQLPLDGKVIRALVPSSPWVDLDNVDYFYKYSRSGVEDTIMPIIKRPAPALLALLLARYRPVAEGPDGERLSYMYDRNKNGFAYYVYAGKQ